MPLTEKSSVPRWTAHGWSLSARRALLRSPAFACLLASGMIAAGATFAAAQGPGMTPGSDAPAAVTSPPADAGPPAAVSPPPGSDWPCVQRKVVTLTAAQMWDGPPIGDEQSWRNDKAITDLTPYLVSRRVDMDAAEEAIRKFAESVPEAERDQKLTQLFDAVLHETNSVRSTVVNGVEKFQQRQRARSQRLEQQGTEIAALNDRAAKGESVTAELAKLQNEYDWNARVFKERQDNMTLACEVPVLIEQRAYAIARAIRNHMSD